MRRKPTAASGRNKNGVIDLDVSVAAGRYRWVINVFAGCSWGFPSAIQAFGPMAWFASRNKLSGTRLGTGAKLMELPAKAEHPPTFPRRATNGG
jgi:hypothetical protein